MPEGRVRAEDPDLTERTRSMTRASPSPTRERVPEGRVREESEDSHGTHPIDDWRLPSPTRERVPERWATRQVGTARRHQPVRRCPTSDTADFLVWPPRFSGYNRKTKA